MELEAQIAAYDIIVAAQLRKLAASSATAQSARYVGPRGPDSPDGSARDAGRGSRGQTVDANQSAHRGDASSHNAGPTGERARNAGQRGGGGSKKTMKRTNGPSITRSAPVLPSVSLSATPRSALSVFAPLFSGDSVYGHSPYSSSCSSVIECNPVPAFDLVTSVIPQSRSVLASLPDSPPTPVSVALLTPKNPQDVDNLKESVLTSNPPCFARCESSPASSSSFSSSPFEIHLNGVDIYDPSYFNLSQNTAPFPSEEFEQLCAKYLCPKTSFREKSLRNGSWRQIPTEEGPWLERNQLRLYLKVKQLLKVENRVAVLIYLRVYERYLTQVGGAYPWEPPSMADFDIVIIEKRDVSEQAVDVDTIPLEGFAAPVRVKVESTQI